MEAVMERQDRSEKTIEETSLHGADIKGIFRGVQWMVGTILVAIGLFLGYLTYITQTHQNHSMLSSEPTYTAAALGEQ